MIDIKVKIHDKFSVEFKVGFVVDEDNRDNDFAINTWIFIPNSLDINPSTYDKDDFYRDVKSNVRMITPIVLLNEITIGSAVPLKHLKKALNNLSESVTKETIADYEYHIKMFTAIVKSAMRDEIDIMNDCSTPEEIEMECDLFINNVRHILQTYRELGKMIDTPEITPEIRNIYSFGDEFMTHLAESYSFRATSLLDSMADSPIKTNLRERLIALIKEECNYKKSLNYITINSENPTDNRLLVYRHGILKKYIGSALYIKINKKRDGQTVREIYYSIAAGIAMVFATVIAFLFQRKFGNFSGPLFVALVVSYMLKDRIKDLTRYYFAHRLRRKYFDNKADINIKDHTIGWLKEGMDFITEDKIPSDVLEIRARTPLLEAENRIFDEKIILYRKLVYIDGIEIAKYKGYTISGINDIFRIHLNRFTMKMDDPQVPLRQIIDNDKTSVIYTDKIYYINFIMQFRQYETLEYKRFRLVLTRNGIIDIEEMN